MKKQLAAVILILISCNIFAQGNRANDGDWSQRFLVLKNTPEADVMIRVGDVDNLNFGFEPGFNPFCGRSTVTHAFPWEPLAEDPSGTDRIMVPSSYKDVAPCGGDGYSGSTGEATKPGPIKMDIRALAGTEIRSIALVMFVDDFQSPQFCSKFQLTLNGKRFYDGERVLNSLDQSGPVGKIVTIPVSEDLFSEFKKNELLILIDDPTTKAADGFAIDFVKLLINYKPQLTCIGKMHGYVLEEGTNNPITGAFVEVRGYGQTTTDAKGYFQIEKLPAGLQVASATKEGYEPGYKAGDISEEEGEDVTIYLKPAGKTATYQGKEIKQGESLVMNNILFDQGKADLRKESLPELDKVVEFLKANPGALIELSGHTSSEGTREVNRSLSFQRVNSCRTYITGKGISAERISIVGYGPDRPIASNDTEEGRNQNRRVEMKVLKL